MFGETVRTCVCAFIIAFGKQLSKKARRSACEMTTAAPSMCIDLCNRKDYWRIWLPPIDTHTPRTLHMSGNEVSQVRPNRVNRSVNLVI